MPVSTDGFGNGVSVSSSEALVLHEHEVPDLDEAIAILIR
jgi:hypothetical protein